MSKTEVDIATSDGVAESHVFQPAGTGPWPAVLFYMDGGGLRDAIFAMAQRLADNGYYVLLPNLYYRAGPIDAQAAFGNPATRENMMALIQSLTNTLLMRDTVAFLDFLSRQPGVNSARIGCHGYCMGGKFALSAAGTFPDRVAAAAAFHGAGMATDQADSAHLLAAKVRAKIYIGVAGIDPWLVPGETARLREALDAARVDYVMENYPGVQHGFCVPGQVYDHTAAERHWERLLKLYDATLK